ncbi:MAG: hypothetical protein ACR2F8_06960 [Caulobacteraceae bacterium]
MIERLDLNTFEIAACRLVAEGAYAKAVDIYLFMSDGDPSLDGGYLGKRLGECHAALGDKWAAKFWYGRAMEENPVVNADCAARIAELGELNPGDLLA